MDTSGPSAWRAYVHLYLPMLTSLLLILTPIDPFANQFLVAACAIPTYVLGSVVYSTNGADPSPAQVIRFTRKKDLYRVALLFTYGRIHGTPFNARYFLSDLFLNYMLGWWIIGEREVGEPQRRSEFAVHVLWVLASGVVFHYIIPRSWTTLWVLTGSVDRAMWRAAYLALVDDVIGMLAYPNLETKKRRACVILVQAVMIFLTVGWVKLRIAMVKMRNEEDFVEGGEATQ
ncbi:hypothetical protein K504DRAFT_467852 [Pleomassaria siparia CBS 279.74]|uniref:Uncharacterized protein n=1 Tax=Pleomassaria siparia CBS 279.74 TaxID=1314801 RepID=A0A6G1K808_9PLEO|nr:hypothetical protein K504DRAFT_467852 [Pleomassaria siparia CBS 279.74]